MEKAASTQEPEEPEDKFEESFETMQISTRTELHDNSSNTPYGDYEYSQSTILAQHHPDDRSPMAHSSTNTSYADSSHTTATQASHDTGTEQKPKKKRLKKFCMLPPKDSHGNKDPTWVQIFMENMDEVTAHTSLFFPSDTYEQLIGDVGSRIEEWVRENESWRLVREMEHMN